MKPKKDERRPPQRPATLIKRKRPRLAKKRKQLLEAIKAMRKDKSESEESEASSESDSPDEDSTKLGHAS